MSSNGILRNARLRAGDQKDANARHDYSVKTEIKHLWESKAIITIILPGVKSLQLDGDDKGPGCKYPLEEEQGDLMASMAEHGCPPLTFERTFLKLVDT